MYNPLVKAADADSMLNSMDAWNTFQKDVNERAAVKPGAEGLYRLDYTQPKPSGRSFYKLDYSEPVSQMPADVRKNMETMPKSSWDTLLDTIKKYYGYAKNNIKASGGVMNWLGGNSQTLGGAPRWLVAGGGLAGLLGLGLGAKSLLSKSGSYHPVQGLPMAKLASARAMRAEDPTLLGGVSAGRPDITEGNSIGRMLEIIRTHGNQNAPYGATMPKSAADESEGQEKEDEKKKLKVNQSGVMKRMLTSMGTTTGGTLLGGGLGALAGNAIGGGNGLLAGALLGSLAGGGTGLYAGDRIAVGNGWIPDELSTTPGQIASTMGGALAGGIPAAIASEGKLGLLGGITGGLLGNYLHKKLSGRQYPNYEVVDDL